nr:hypothetical protein [Tanacetum cinerariifolium]
MQQYLQHEHYALWEVIEFEDSYEVPANDPSTTTTNTTSGEAECRAPRNQDRGRRDNYRQGSKAEEHAPKALMAIDRVGWDWSYMVNDEEDHALVADE